MRKILSIVSNNIETGGVEFYLCKVLDKINLRDISIDLVVPGHVISMYHADILKSLGCNIIELNINDQGIKRYTKFRKKLKCIIDSCKYDVIHVNTGALSIEAIALSVGHRIPIRIAHSHGTVIKKNVLVEVCRNLLRKTVVMNATHMLACSKSAAESLYGAKVSDNAFIAQNGIEVDKYRFDGETRNRVRHEHNWHDRFVIGCVGRIAWEKNHNYLLQIFECLHQRNNHALLVIVGTGELEGEMKKQARERKIGDNIQFMGVRNDVNELLQGMDVFVLTSIREALGIVNIEAQASGMHCIVSDVVSEEVNATGLVDFLSVQEKPEVWADKILEYDNGYIRKNTTQCIKDKGFDLSTSAEIVDKIYHGEI